MHSEIEFVASTKEQPRQWAHKMTNHDDRLPAHLRRLIRLAVVSAFAGALLGGVISLVVDSQFRAEMTLMPVSTDGRSIGGGALSGIEGLGGLASLAGIGGSDSAKYESMELLDSHILAMRFIEAHQLLPVLFAKKWDAEARRWKTKAEDEPTLWDGDKSFHDIVKISEDRRTGIVRLSVTWKDRQLAADWANGIVDSANEYLRQAALDRSNKNLSFLNQQIERTNVLEVRQAVFKLIESEMKKMMLAQTTREYAFRVIDPAVPPKKRIWPKTLLMIAFGGIFGIIVVLVGEVANKAIRNYLAENLGRTV